MVVLTWDPLSLSCLDFFLTTPLCSLCSPEDPWSTFRRSRSNSDLLFSSSSFFHFWMHSLVEIFPPYSEGSIEVSTLFWRWSRLEWVLNLCRIFSLSRLLANWKIKFIVHGRWRKWISLCLIGRALSQQAKALETSDGVQIEIWLQLTSFSSKTYVNPLTWFSSSLRRVSNVMTWALIRSLTVYLDESKAAAWEKMTRLPCWSLSGKTKMYPFSTRSDKAGSWTIH